MPRCLIISLLIGAVILSEPVFARVDGTRPRGAIGLDAVGTRDLEARLARTEAERDSYAAKLGLSRRLMRSVALQVGLANPRYTDSQFLAAVETMADRARALQLENVRLRDEIARLNDPLLRDPALALLGQAEIALDEGRIADAERLYGQIATQRWGDSKEALTAWVSALRSQATAAELEGSKEAFDRSDALNRQVELLLDQLTAQEKLASKTRRMESALREAESFGRRRGFERAITIFRDEIFPTIQVELLTEQLLPTHLIYVRAMAGVAAKEGGTNGKALLDDGLKHIEQLAARGDTSRLEDLPIPLQLKYIELTFDRFALMDLSEIKNYSKVDLMANLLSKTISRSKFSQLRGFNDLQFLSRDQVDLLITTQKIIVPFVRREDILFAAREAVDHTSKSVTASIEAMSFIVSWPMAGLIFGPGPGAFGPINRDNEPDLWMAITLRTGEAFFREAESGAAMHLRERMGENTTAELRNLAEMLVRSAALVAEQRGNTQRQAEAYYIAATSALTMLEKETTPHADQIANVMKALKAALELRPIADVPLEWAETTLAIARTEALSANVDVSTHCANLSNAVQHFAAAISLMQERLPASQVEPAKREWDEALNLHREKCVGRETD